MFLVRSVGLWGAWLLNCVHGPFSPSQATPSLWLWVVWLGMRRPMRCSRNCWTLLFRTDMEDTSLQTNTRLTSTPVTSRYEDEVIDPTEIILSFYSPSCYFKRTQNDVLRMFLSKTTLDPTHFRCTDKTTETFSKYNLLMSFLLLYLITDTVILLIQKTQTFCSCRVVMTWTPITCWALVSEQAGASVDSVCRPTAVVEREEPLRSSLWKVHHYSTTSVYLKHDKKDLLHPNLQTIHPKMVFEIIVCVPNCSM